MNFLKALLIGVVGAVIAVFLMRAANWDGASELRLASQPAFDRVMQSQTLRCISGYPAPDFSPADPERDLHRKLTHNMVEQMGRILSLKIDWVEDVAPDQIDDHLAKGQEDAMCFPIWPSGATALTLDFTAPVDYLPMHVYVRADDTRFDGDLAKLDDANVTISVIESSASKNITDQDFPHAKQYSLTEDADNPHLLLAVTTRKADAVFADPYAAAAFLKNNPSTLKRVANVPPVRMFGETFAVAKGETKLRDMMNTALAQMQQSGFIRGTLDKYLPEHKGEYFYVGKPWE